MTETCLVPDRDTPWTKQEAFDQVVEMFFERRLPKCTNGLGGCAYRANRNTNACFAGVLIPDSQYKTYMEAKRIHAIRDLIPALSGLDVQFLTKLQGIHDTLPRAAWATRLYSLAESYELSADRLDQALKPKNLN